MSIRTAFSSVLRRPAAALFPLLFGLAGCGSSHTGFALHVVPPPTTEFRVPDDYDTIRVQVAVDGGEANGSSYPITVLDKPPYTLLVLLDKTEHFKVDQMSVSITKNGIELKTAILKDLIVKQGELVDETIDFSQQQ